MKPLTIFLGGLAVGAIAGLLLAPEKGEDLRDRIKAMLKKRGIIPPNDIETIIAEINADLETSSFGIARRPSEDDAE